MKTLKKTLCLVLAVVMVVGVLILPAYAKDDYTAATKALQNYGVLQGYPDGKLHEDASITRGQMAAIIYRIMTGDTGATDAEVAVKYGSYADIYSDANVAPWAKGYIGFCTNKGVLKGYDTGKIEANKQINGYEVRAMLLRALGYDKNNEYTGNEWRKYVLADSTQTGISANVKDLDPADKTPRGAVAQLTYDATKADMVGPSILPTVGYTSLGKKLISVGTPTSETDDFGVPQTKTTIKFQWPDTPVEKTFTVTAKLLDRWYTPVVECDVATAADIDDNELFTTYTNGKANKAYVTINPTDERSTIGAYGRETSLYDGNIIVYKDVVLAKVNKVVPAVTDGAGHEVTAASYNVTIYYGDGTTGYEVADTSVLGTTTTFAKGDMIRAYCVASTSNLTSATTFTKLAGATKVTPTQVTIDSILENASATKQSGFKGTDGVTYMYANTYSYKKGALETLKGTSIGTTWGVYTDGQNNVLSIVPAATVKGYGIVTDADVEKIAFGKYAAKLTILTSDNKTVTVQMVSPQDEYFISENNAASYIRNERLMGALVEYKADTSFAVAGYTDVTPSRNQSGLGNVYAGDVYAINGSNLVNDDTVFFIAQYANSASKGGYTANGYKVVKGFKNINDLSHDYDKDKVDGDRVAFSASYFDTNSDGWIDYALISGATTVKEDKKEDVENYAFLVNKNGMVDKHDEYSLYQAIIDGTQTTLKLTYTAAESVISTGLYTYAERNTNNGAYGDVRLVASVNDGVYNWNRVNAIKNAGSGYTYTYKAGALLVDYYPNTEHPEDPGFYEYRAVADDAKIYFVNPDTGKCYASTYDLETIITADFDIEYICYQTNEYGFIDLLYVVTDKDGAKEDDPTDPGPFAVTLVDGTSKKSIAMPSVRTVAVPKDGETYFDITISVNNDALVENSGVWKFGVVADNGAKVSVERLTSTNSLEFVYRITVSGITAATTVTITDEPTAAAIKDLEEGETYSIPAGATIADLSGTIKGNLEIANGAKVTISGETEMTGELVFEEGAELTVDASGKTVTLPEIPEDGTVKVTNGTVKVMNGKEAADIAGTVTVEGGSLEAANVTGEVTVSSTAGLTVTGIDEGGKVTANSTGTVSVGDVAGELDVQQGTVTADDVTGTVTVSNDATKVTIGSIAEDAEVSAEDPSKITVAENVDVVNEAIKFTADENTKGTVTNVANLGNKVPNNTIVEIGSGDVAEGYFEADTDNMFYNGEDDKTGTKLAEDTMIGVSAWIDPVNKTSAGAEGDVITFVVTDASGKTVYEDEMTLEDAHNAVVFWLNLAYPSVDGCSKTATGTLYDSFVAGNHYNVTVTRTPKDGGDDVTMFKGGFTAKVGTNLDWADDWITE